eukprot:9616268-Alexandrium_andersonii.AAC.1
MPAPSSVCDCVQGVETIAGRGNVHDVEGASPVKRNSQYWNTGRPRTPHNIGAGEEGGAEGWVQYLGWEH